MCGVQTTFCMLQQRMTGVAHRLVLVDVDRGHARPPGFECGHQRAGLDQRRAAGVDEQRGRLHAREIVRGDDAARRIDQPHVQRDDVAALEECLLARRGRSRPRAPARAIAAAPIPARSCRTPCRSRRPPRRSGRSRKCPSVLPRSVVPTPICQLPALSDGHLLRDLAHGREDQAPGQLGGSIGRRSGMLARRHDDAEPRAGVDVDMRIDAALADQLELRQALEQRRRELSVRSRISTRTSVSRRRAASASTSCDVVVPDRDVVTVELAEAGERAQRVESSRRGSRFSWGRGPAEPKFWRPHGDCR